MPPTTSADFDRAYRLPFTIWGDLRVPMEIKALARHVRGELRVDRAQRTHGTPHARGTLHDPQPTSLELGCGVGRFSRYLAHQGLRATAVDFSPVAIAKAQERVAHDAVRPEFLVGSVTRLDTLRGPFDMSFDVGCFHCLDANRQRGYVSEVSRLLKPGGTHLIWALDEPPSDIRLSPGVVKEIFAHDFDLQNAQASRRRLARSHWYWLVRLSK